MAKLAYLGPTLCHRLVGIVHWIFAGSINRSIWLVQIPKARQGIENWAKRVMWGRQQTFDVRESETSNSKSEIRGCFAALSMTKVRVVIEFS
jgi:hypothetical protein